MTHRLALLFCLFCFSTCAGAVATTNLLLNPGGEDNTLVNWTVGGDAGPHLDNGTFDSNIKPHSGTNQFVGGHGAVGTLTQIVPLVGNPGVTAVSIDSGTLLAYVSFWEQGLAQGAPDDDGYVNIVFLGATSNTISGWAAPEIDSAGVWSNYSSYLPIPAGTRFVQYTMNFIRHEGSDLDAFIDDNVVAVTDYVHQPVLGPVAATTTNVVFSWPTLYSDGFQLQQNTNLTVTNWIVASTPFQITNGSNRVTFAMPPTRQFFRLYHP